MEALAEEALEAEGLQEVGKMNEMDELNCPRCKKAMEKIKKADVVIDICPKCHGMWLDEGEMEKLAEYGKTIIE